MRRDRLAMGVIVMGGALILAVGVSELGQAFSAAGRAMAGSGTEIIVIAFVIMVLTVGGVYAFIRGLNRHVGFLSLPAPAARPQLPSPLSPYGPPRAQQRPFTGESEYARPEPEQAPRPAPDAPIGSLCEGPGCTALLDSRPFTAGLLGEDEEHSFCSRDCAQAWMQAREEPEPERRGLHLLRR